MLENNFKVEPEIIIEILDLLNNEEKYAEFLRDIAILSKALGRNLSAFECLNDKDNNEAINSITLSLQLSSIYSVCAFVRRNKEALEGMINLIEKRNAST